jgi:hypothetical protein
MPSWHKIFERTDPRYLKKSDAPVGDAHIIEEDGIAVNPQQTGLNFTGAGVTVTANIINGSTDVDIPGGGSGEANVATNQGGGEGLAMTKTGVILPFKTLIAGTNISLSANVNEFTIVSTGGGGGGDIEGGNASSVYDPPTAIDGGGA